MLKLSGIFVHVFAGFCCFLAVVTARGLVVEPDFLFVDEDWPLEKPLSLSICSDSVEKLQIISGNDDNRFALVKNNQTCASLKINKPFDADQLHSDGTRWQSFSLLFQGAKKGKRASLDIQVVDVNDNAPKFVNWRSELNISEKQSVGSVIQRIQTFDPDTGVGGIVRFFTDTEKFGIENERCSNSYCHADLVLKLPLDYESNAVEKVSIIARDGASLTKHANEATANLTINVVDEQDTPPTFLTLVTKPIILAENLAVGAKILQVKAVDGDRFTSRKNEVLYELGGGHNNEYFQIDPITGVVTLKQKLDREAVNQMSLTITAVEQDDVKMSSEMTVEIVVEDSDDNPPQCSSSKYIGQLNRRTKKLTINKPITAFDVDQGKNSQFDVDLKGEYAESFQIKPRKVQGSTDLTLIVVDYDSLEYVTDKEIILEVILTPRETSQEVSSTKCLIIIQLDPAVEQTTVRPFKLTQDVYNVQLMENMPPQQVLANLTDEANDGEDIVYTIEGDGATLFSINEESQFVTSESLDAESRRSYNLKITASKNDQLSTAVIHVKILDENDNSPIFEKPHYIFNVTEETEATFYVKAIDRDSQANGNVSYGIVDPIPKGIIINPKTGRILVEKIDVDKMASPVVKFQVFAIDSGSEPLKTTANVTVNIKDVNDNVPFFSKRAYSVILACGTELNSTVVKVKAIDMDLTGSKIKYELPGEMQKYFQVDPMTGFVILIGHLPKSKREVHFNVIARDYGKPPKQAVTRVTVRMAECTEDTSIETIVDQVVEEMTTFHTASSTREPSTMTTSKLKKKMTTTTTPIVIEERAENVAQNKSFNKLDGTTRVFVPRHLTAQVDENSPVGTRIIQIDVNNDTTSYDIHFSTQNADHAKLIKLTKLGELRVADNIDFEKVQFINGSIFARFGKRNLLYATITINVIDKNDNKPVFRLPKSFVLRLPVDTEIGYVLDLPYPLTTDQDVSLDYSTIQYELKENNANGNICFKIDKNSSIIQLVNPIASCGTEKLNLTIKAIDNPGGNPEDINSVNYTLSIEVIEGKNVTSENAAPLNTTSELLSNLSSEIYVFDDEPIGSVLLVISNDEIARNITRTNPLINVSRLSIELSVKNSDVVELTPTSELKLRKSLKGYVNQKLCVQIGAKITIESSIPQSITKNVCLIVKSRPKAPIVHFPLHNSVHKFKENTKYESLLVFNATSTVLDPKLNGLKYGIIESDNNDDWKEFTVDSRGILKAKNTFDYEVKDKYNLQVQICDYNDSCTTVTFRIQVEDLNDHCPSFTNKLETLEILENQPANATGLLVGSFTPAEDADGTAEKWSVCYKLEEEDSIFFLPDTRKPSLFVKKSLDREEMSQYNVTVVALDCHFKERELNCTDDNPRGSYKKLLIINVADVNDNFPKFTQKEYYGNVIERKTKFGAKILQVQARDPDVETRKLHYSMSSAVRTESDVIPKEEAPFHIDAATGNIISHVIYSAKMPHSYNFRVVVKDGAGHEDEASVTISVINYNEQVELVFDQPEDSTRKNQNQIAKLMFDITKMYFVVDEISGHGNSTNMLAHFLEKDKLLASASKALLIFEESKAEQAQRARHELRRTYSLKKIFTDNSEPNMINNAFMAAVEKHAFVIGAVAVGVLTLLFMLMTYMCCHCSSKTSGKMNCSSFNQDLIYGNGNPNSTLGFGLRLPKTETGMVNNMALPNTLQRTSTLAQQRPNNHVQPPPQTHDLMNPKQPGPQNLQMFDALQSTEL